MKLFDLSGRTALVTGSSRGLGYVMARGLAGAGASIVLNGRNVENLHQAEGNLRRDGLRAGASCFDVTDEDSVEEAVESIESGIAPIDILVNNAGVHLRGPLEELESNTWHQVLNVNLSGAFYVSRAVGRRMIRRRRGKIINIVSLMSERVRQTCAPYAVSKSGVKMLTKALAVEWGRYNVQVNAIGPGYFVSDMTRPLKEDAEFDRWVCEKTPASRWGEPEELVGCAIFLASDASSFVNGQVIYVDGGWLAAL